MWTTIINANSTYLIRLITTPSCIMYFSDFKDIWSEELSKDDCVERFKELNPICQTTDVLKELTSLFENVAPDTVEIEHLAETVKFLIRCEIDELVISFSWELTKRLNDVFFKEVTLNLINTVQTLEVKQQELFSLLERKDREIDEYNREYGKISRDFLVTKRFDKDNFSNPQGDNLVLHVLSDSSVLNNFANRHGIKVHKRKSEKDVKGSVKKLKPYVPKYLT